MIKGDGAQWCGGMVNEHNVSRAGSTPARRAWLQVTEEKSRNLTPGSPRLVRCKSTGGMEGASSSGRTLFTVPWVRFLLPRIPSGIALRREDYRSYKSKAWLIDMSD